MRSGYFQSGRWLAAGLLGVFYSAAVYPAGYQIQEQSVKGLGNAFAGGTAIAEDASIAAYNPAGLTRLDRQLLAGLHIIVPRAKFKDQSSTNAIGGTVSGKRSDDGGGAAAVPNLFYANPFNDSVSFGFTSTSFYGLATEYDDDWIGRYHAVKSELITLNLNPSLAFRVNDQLSLGFGLSAQYADAELTNALDFGTLAALSGAPIPASTAEFDGFTKVTGDDWGFGYNLGLLYELNPGTRFGLGYRSKIDHKLEGDNKLTVPDFIVQSAGPTRTRGATARVSIPATFSISAYHELNPQWAIMGDVTWTDWSEFDELRIKFNDDPVNPNPSDSVQPENWDDAFRYSIGVNYKHSDALTLRAGLAYDETPVETEFRTPRIPDNSRTWLAIGASYRLSEAFSFDFAYTHIFISDTTIDDTEVTTGGLSGAPIGNTLDGDYEASVDLVSAQLQWDF